MMNRFKIVLFVVLPFVVTANVSVGQNGISLAEIEKLQSPLSVNDVERNFGKTWQQCHGPCIWYPSGNYPDKELWFWVLPTARGIEFEDADVAFIAIVAKNNPDDFEIIWPKELKNKNKKDVFNDYRKRLSEEAAKYENLHDRDRDNAK